MYDIMSSGNSHSFTFSCLIWISVLSFSCVITLAGSSNTMFNKRGESRHPCLVSDLRGNAFSFLQLILMLAVGLMYMAFIASRYIPSMGFPGGAVVKNPPASAEMKETRVRFLGQEDPWSRKWQPTQVLLPGKFHGQRSLVGYRLGGYEQSDMTELLSTQHAYSLHVHFLDSFFFFFNHKWVLTS